MNIPVLIVCYLRPKNLNIILGTLVGTNRKVYIFIDKAPSHLEHVTAEIKEVIRKYSDLDITIIESRINCGVDKAVPTAVDQVLLSESKTIVLEDDCIPNEFALEYFDFFSKYLAGKVVMISGRSSKVSPAHKQVELGATYSSYPLINGWLVNREGWNRISPLQHQTKIKKIVVWLVKNPRRILPFAFFWAAIIRVRNGQLKAWDSSMAFNMLVEDLLSINPDRTSVTVLGVDDVASNTKIIKSTVSEIYLNADKLMPSLTLNTSHSAKKNADHEIESEIYKIGVRNLFSPLFAALRVPPRRY